MPQAHPWQVLWFPEAERELLLSIILSLTSNFNISWEPVETAFTTAGHNFTRGVIKQRYARILRPFTEKLTLQELVTKSPARRQRAAAQYDPIYVDGNV